MLYCCLVQLSVVKYDGVVLLFSTVRCCEVWWCCCLVQLSVVKYGGFV